MFFGQRLVYSWFESSEQPWLPCKSETDTLFTAYLEPFAQIEPLRQRVLTVLQALPESVQQDFLEDPRFRVALENYEPGRGWSVWMHLPDPNGQGSRCVVLKRKLADCGEAFATYVIAHEFAHAFLRNGGWGEITDREEAADHLAADWGFPRPASHLI